MEDRVNSESFVIGWQDNSKTSSVSLQNAFLKFKKERQVSESYHKRIVTINMLIELLERNQSTEI